MREIKFRGYNIKNKKWLYGCFLINRGEYFICPDGIQNPLATWEDFVVEPESVGQFTGFKDSKGNGYASSGLLMTAEIHIVLPDGLTAMKKHSKQVCVKQSS